VALCGFVKQYLLGGLMNGKNKRTKEQKNDVLGCLFERLVWCGD
jgi:hypothetical protein